MIISPRLLVPAVLLLAGCATATTTYNSGTIPTAAAAPAAAPQRINAVSDALGARTDNMVASRPATTGNLTR